MCLGGKDNDNVIALCMKSKKMGLRHVSFHVIDHVTPFP